MDNPNRSHQMVTLTKSSAGSLSFLLHSRLLLAQQEGSHQTLLDVSVGQFFITFYEASKIQRHEHNIHLQLHDWKGEV